jgi:hypothetical protein
MPCSSLTAAARSQCLLDLLARLPGRRERRGRRHWLAGLLAVGIAAVTAGSRSFAAIGQWAAGAGAGMLAGLGAVRGPAGESTFGRAFALTSADVLGQVMGAWRHARATQAGGRLVVAVGGEAVRGARNRDEKPRTWSRPWRTVSARSSARSPWTRSPMRSLPSGNC